MKVKILLFPLFLVLIMADIIWFVYPSYDNPGGGGMKQKRADLVAREQKTTALTEKADNIRSLGDYLSRNPAKKTMLLQYLPEGPDEEKIINELNKSAGDSKLALTAISIEKIIRDGEDDPRAGLPAGTSVSVGGNTSSASKISAGKAEVEVKALGNYPGIKDFFQKVEKLRRFSKVKTLSVEHPSEDGATSDLLVLDAVLEFNFLSPVKDIISIESTPFPSGNFDMKIVDNIERAKVSQSEIDRGTLGKSNPFTP